MRSLPLAAFIAAFGLSDQTRMPLVRYRSAAAPFGEGPASDPNRKKKRKAARAARRVNRLAHA